MAKRASTSVDRESVIRARPVRRARLGSADLGGWSMRAVRWLAVLPFLAMLVGPFFLNRVSPPILGMPFLLAWLVAWILLTSVIMAVIFWVDPENRDHRP